MNKFWKIVMLIFIPVTLLVVAGVIGYNTSSAFKNYLNRTILNRSDSKASIGFTPSTDIGDNDNPNEVPSITPDEFAEQYRVELPAEFMGGRIYVKEVNSNKLLISSQVCTSILCCDLETDEYVSQYLSYSNWNIFYELDNGDCFVSSSLSGSGLLLYKASDDSIDCVLENYYSCANFFTVSNGDIYFQSCGISGTSVKYYTFRYSDGVFNSIAQRKLTDVVELDDGSLLFLETSGYTIYHYNPTDGAYTLVFSGVTGISNFYKFSNGNVFIATSSSSSKSHFYNALTQEFIELYSVANPSILTYEDYALISSEKSTNTILLNITDGTYEVISDNIYSTGFLNITDTQVMLHSYGLYLFDFETKILSTLSSDKYSFDYYKLNDNNYYFYYFATPTTYIYYFDASLSTLSKVCSTRNDKTDVDFLIFDNYGIVYFSANYTSGDSDLSYYDYSTKSTTLVLYQLAIISIEQIDESRCLIKTSTEVDYEFDVEAKTLTLIYNR